MGEVKKSVKEFISAAYAVPGLMQVTLELSCMLYGNPSQAKGVVRVAPGMSGSPSVEYNGRLQPVVQSLTCQDYLVVVVGFPGTLGKGVIEQRTMATNIQNMVDAQQQLYEEHAILPQLPTIMMGRSAGGTIAIPAALQLGVSKVIIVAGRLDTKVLYDEVMEDEEGYPRFVIDGKTFYGFGTLTEDRAQYIIPGETTQTVSGKMKYLQNFFYIEELATYQNNIQEAIDELPQETQLLVIHGKDDATVPVAAVEGWQTLCDTTKNVSCQQLVLEKTGGHSISNKEAQCMIAQKITCFVSNTS